jgi:hypothetical protein
MAAEQHDADPAGAPSGWRPFATVALFSLLPFLTFLADNAGEAEIDARLVAYAVVLLAIGVAVVLLARRRGPRAAETVAVLFAVVTFLLFQFVLVKKVVGRLGLPPDYLVTTLAWAAGLAVALLIFRRLAREPAVWAFALLFGALLAGYSAFAFATGGGGASSGSAGKVPVELRGAEAQGPDVWFFLLDGYGRADVLREVTGADQGPFLDRLRDRGFDVNPDAAAAYPRTVGSLASTLAMDYVLEPGQEATVNQLAANIRGRNATVQAFRGLGYRYAAATDYAEISCRDEADICVEPPEGPGFGSRSVVLDATPLGQPARALARRLEGDTPANLMAPDQAARAIIERAGDGPLFVYAHLIVPHPPYRFDGKCGRSPIPDINKNDWVPRETGRYATAVGCVDRQLERAVDAILERDPDAAIVLAGDHGPAFRVPLTRSANDWTDDQIRQRFGILSALRPPPRCAGQVKAPEVPVNTFRAILGCVTGRPVPLLPTRRFSMAYGDASVVRDLRPIDLRAR